MRFFSTLVATVVAGSVLAVAATTARAQTTLFSLALTPSVQTGTAGTSVLFSGTVANDGTTTLFLNSISFNFDGSAGSFLTADDSPFYAVGFPASLAPGDSQNVTIFGMAIDPSTLPGAYTGSVLISGGLTDTDLDLLGPTGSEAVPFEVDVVSSGAAPEPATGVFAVAGLGVLVARRRRR